ncbi:hypothetical protein U6A24_02460 [Aquimarina gracilis]|uniref:Lipid/polyisoprenoid-binding YceI-like domain-containing protein n=1 Tax=Aquimarina gracilis TaxID=874422 RepID=A0ABU5ZSE9_9FLAO|nr:hypothetical protein [Aquimarina gracilis]MEB3344302.1 hypothetical protein [Aquimarina gracilis]
MKITRIIFLIIITLFILACNNDNDYSDLSESETILLKVIGRGTVLGQPKTIVHPKTEEELEANCFLMDLVDPDTEEIIGTLQDCVLSMLVPSDGTITSEVITSININQRGTIQAENLVFHEVRSPILEFNFDTSFTPTENNVMSTTLEFEGMKGKVSLEGEANLSQLQEGIITFNNLFTIELEK